MRPKIVLLACAILAVSGLLCWAILSKNTRSDSPPSIDTQPLAPAQPVAVPTTVRATPNAKAILEQIPQPHRSNVDVHPHERDFQAAFAHLKNVKDELDEAAAKLDDLESAESMQLFSKALAAYDRALAAAERSGQTALDELAAFYPDYADLMRRLNRARLQKDVVD